MDVCILSRFLRNLIQMENNPFEDQLSECCSEDVEPEGAPPFERAMCSNCKHQCSIKPKTLSIDVHDDVKVKSHFGV